MGVYGIALAGWSLEQQIRAAGRPAQFRADDQLRIAAELAIAAPLLMANTLSLRQS
jgi:hypothetical protein